MQDILWSTNTLQNLSNQRYCGYSSLHFNCRAFSLTWQAAIFFFFTETQDQISSAAPAAFHAEPHTYRTYAFIFCMVIFVSGKWLVGVCVQRRRRTIWRPYLLTYALHTSMQFDIWGPFYGQVTGVKSMYPLTSSTWPHRGHRLELNVFFFYLTTDQIIDFHWIMGSSISPNYKNKPKNRCSAFRLG